MAKSGSRARDLCWCQIDVEKRNAAADLVPQFPRTASPRERTETFGIAEIVVIETGRIRTVRRSRRHPQQREQDPAMSPRLNYSVAAFLSFVGSLRS
jgi:hypothetical protein